MNFANYGVPQTRSRLILIAHQEYQPRIPTPTHAPSSGLFLEPWNSWYAAIEDLLDTLPESKFAQWQLDLLEKKGYNAAQIKKDFYLSVGTDSRPRFKDQPATTVTTSRNQYTSQKALLMVNQKTSRTSPRDSDQPALTVTSSKMHKAFLVDGAPGKHQTTITVRKQDQPSFTTTASQNHRPVRAWLESSRVVKMTVRANARFQSFPDDYVLPERKALAQKGVGNAVPPLGAYHFGLAVNK